MCLSSDSVAITVYRGSKTNTWKIPVREAINSNLERWSVVYWFLHQPRPLLSGSVLRHGLVCNTHFWYVFKLLKCIKFVSPFSLLMSWVWHKQFKAFRFRVTFTYTTSVDVTSAKCYMYLVPMALTWNVTVDISTNNSLEKDNNFYVYLLRARTRLHLQKKSCRVNFFLYSCS